MRGRHERFLKRNGEELVAIMGGQPKAPETDRPLVVRLLVLAATGKPPHLVDGRALRHLENRFGIDNLDTADVDTWRERLSDYSTLLPDAAERVAGLLDQLLERDDFPELEALGKWGIHYWRNLLDEAGMDPLQADTIASLYLDRERYAPGGENSRIFYERLGLKMDDGGALHPKALFPSDVQTFRWHAARFANEVCTPSTEPGGETCEACPLRKFCKAYRNANRTDLRGGEDPEVVDLFAGAGGMSLGLQNAGFRIRAAVENWQKAADTYRLNHPELDPDQVLERDVKELADDADFIETNDDVPLVVGGPPCQPFSMARRHSDADKNDPRRYLFRPFIDVVEQLDPKLVLMENVPGLLNADKERVFEDLLERFGKAGFETDHRIVEADDFGVPQNRKRVFLVGVNTDKAALAEEIIEAFWAALDAQRVEDPPSLGDALHGLPKLEPGEGGVVHRGGVQGPRSDYAHRMMNGGTTHRNHRAREHNERDIEIFSELREGERAIELEERHREEHGEGIIPYQLESFQDKYRRLEWGNTAPTIPAHLERDANAFVHPQVPRGITCREAARLQSFPDDYLFLGGFTFSFKQVGNAVPPRMAEAVGGAAKSVLEDASYWID